jgi:hypothetical protein
VASGSVPVPAQLAAACGGSLERAALSPPSGDLARRGEKNEPATAALLVVLYRRRKGNNHAHTACTGSCREEKRKKETIGDLSLAPTPRR